MDTRFLISVTWFILGAVVHAERQDVVKRSKDIRTDPDILYQPDLFEGDILGISKETIDDYVDEINAQETLSDYFIKMGDNIRYQAIRDQSRLWLNAVIPYSVSSLYTEEGKAFIAEAIEMITNNTCLKFIPRTTQVDYLFITPKGGGCSSFVGRQRGRQQVQLGPDCLNQMGVILHELTHSLGFFHEQSRADRDDYINIQWENIQPIMAANFRQYRLNYIQHLGAEYDYNSVMHYGPFAFTKNGQKTIQAAEPRKATYMGQRRQFSPTDLYKINRLYGCDPSDTRRVEEEETTTLAPTTVMETTITPPFEWEPLEKGEVKKPGVKPLIPRPPSILPPSPLPPLPTQAETTVTPPFSFEETTEESKPQPPSPLPPLPTLSPPLGRPGGTPPAIRPTPPSLFPPTLLPNKTPGTEQPQVATTTAPEPPKTNKPIVPGIHPEPPTAFPPTRLPVKRPSEEKKIEEKKITPRIDETITPPMEETITPPLMTVEAETMTPPLSPENPTMTPPIDWTFTPPIDMTLTPPFPEEKESTVTPRLLPEGEDEEQEPDLKDMVLYHPYECFVREDHAKMMYWPAEGYPRSTYK